MCVNLDRNICIFILNFLVYTLDEAIYNIIETVFTRSDAFVIYWNNYIVDTVVTAKTKRLEENFIV